MKTGIKAVCDKLVTLNNSKLRCNIDEDGVLYIISKTMKYADRIFIDHSDELRIKDDTVTLISEKGTWFGDKEITFSFKTGFASIIR